MHHAAGARYDLGVGIVAKLGEVDVVFGLEEYEGAWSDVILLEVDTEAPDTFAYEDDEQGIDT